MIRAWNGAPSRAPRFHRRVGALLLAGAVAGLGGPAEASGQEPAAPAPDGPVSAFLPDTVLRPPGGPEMVHLPAPGSPLVALRLSVPLTEGRHEAGAGRILQALGEARAAGLATAVGARVSGSRTPWGLTWTVVGPGTDLDFLAFLLRQAAREPVGEEAAFQRLVSELEAEAQARYETPGGRVADRLREAVAPGVPRLGGTPASLRRLTLADVRALWARTHQPSRMRLVVSGPLPLEVLLVSFQELGAPEGVASEAVDRDPGATGRPRAEVLRSWYGEARTIDDPEDPRAEVAALLVAETLRAADDPFETEVQLRQLPDRKILTVMGAAYARNRSAMRRRVSSVLERVAGDLTAASVDRAREALRADLLTGARTPEGRVEVVGRHLDATGDPGAARRYLDDLESVDPASLRAFLEELAAASPATAEVRP